MLEDSHMNTAVHTCSAVALHCIDFRFQKAIHAYLDGRFGGQYDEIALAGGVQSLLRSDAESTFALKQLRTSCSLHHPRHILLFQHEDCGAYGGSSNFKSPSAEREFQLGEIECATKLLAEQFPSCKTERHYIDTSGDIE
jgi:hypothetical protein